MILKSINNLDYVEEEDRFSPQKRMVNLLLIMPIQFKHIKIYLENLITAKRHVLFGCGGR